MQLKRALLSVTDKTGIVDFARGLADHGVELISTSGTAAALRAAGLEVTMVEDLTGYPEMLGGRVRTLHPAVHAGILARRSVRADVEALHALSIRPIDLVCVNLYPFTQLAARRGVAQEELIENIDIGGPTLLRAAAKSHDDVVVVCSPERYGFLLDEIRMTGAVSDRTRRELAGEAFAHTASYDIAVANWFAEEQEVFPDKIFLEYVKQLDLPYGENPHQRAAYYADRSARRHVLSMSVQHQGKALSFNNVADLSAGRELLREFSVPGCVVIKHTNPCGVALAASGEQAFERAWAADDTSAFGSVVVLNRTVTAALAAKIAERFVEVVFAPGFEPAALETLAAKPALRVLEDRERRRANPGERDYHRVMGGLLVQDLDSESEERDLMTVATERTPSEREWGDLLFAWRVCKHVKSNAIVIAKDLQTVGIGAGQMSRVDAVRIALEKARLPVEGAVLASDAFFPFADGPEAALQAGVRSIIQPGGSKRDDEVIEAVETAGATMVFTGRRHFRH